MSLYLKQIEQLVALQKIDNEIQLIETELEHVPLEVDELRQHFAQVDTQKQSLQEKVTHLQEQERRLSLEIEDSSSRTKKSKNKLMQVANTKEYQAILREVDSLERNNKGRQEERMMLVEELSRQSSMLEEATEHAATLNTELESKLATLEARIATANATLKKLHDARKNSGKEVPTPVFARYEFIRSRLANPVIVRVENTICAGCNIAIPPQSYIELQKGAQILSCPNCQRLIYWSEHFAETVSAAKD